MSTKKRRGGYLATVEGVKKLKESKRVKKYTYQQIAEAARETEDKVKRLFNPQWGNGQYKVGEEAVEAICGVLDLKPEDIVSNWYLIAIANSILNEKDLLLKQENLETYYQKAVRAIEEFKEHKYNSIFGEKKLDLKNLRLTKIPAEVWELDKINDLDISNNNLKSISPDIGKLVNLEKLDLSRNQLQDIPPEIGNLKKLRKLVLYHNSLKNLPSEIFDLYKLEKLYFGYNYIDRLPAEIKKLKNLYKLELSNNLVNEIPKEIGELANLERLVLNDNLIKSIPEEIGKLLYLTSLWLHNNKLKTIPTEIGKLSLIYDLQLDSNQLEYIPFEIKNLTNLLYLGLKNNNLPIPPEIVEDYKKPKQIIDYYLSLQNNQQKQIHEAKMLLVGQGNVGKTCLKERLIRNDYDPTRNKTDGIDIEDWKIEIDDKELQVNIWDFGGQEIMHSTHQFFLTKRSLYLLVLDTTQSEEENRIEYWLKIIQSFGKDSPVIVVGNKADQHPLDIDKRGLQQKYPQIKAFYEVSCEKGTGIDELAEFVKQEINQLEHINDALPLPWFNIKEKLEELDKDYIPYEQYESLCEAEGVNKEDNQRILIRLLNDLGIVLNFQDDPRLEDTHVLNPEWVTNGVYKILNDRALIIEDRGILNIPTIKRILDKKRYPKHKHLFIIGMMRKFELCFDVEPDKQFLIPDILPKEEPYTGEWDNTLAFEYHYPVLPGSIISRFIVRMNHYIHQTTYWRSGVVLSLEDNLALVKADREDKIIKVRVKGKTNTKRNLLTAIRSQFDYIHKTIPGIVPVAKVPLIEHPEILLDYQELLGLEAMGEKDIVIGKLKRRIPLKQLLDGIESKSDRFSKPTYH